MTGRQGVEQIRDTNVLIVANPAARGGQAAAWVPQVQARLAELGAATRTVLPGSPERATATVAALAGDELVVALGGDGLMARVAQGALASGATMLPLPGGRGNDFVSHLRIPRSLPKALAALVDWQPRRIDVGRSGERVFLGIASLGYDTVASEIADGTAVLRGPALYVWGGAKALFTHAPQQFTLSVDGADEQVLRAWNIALGNTGRYGGGLQMCPGASVQDGLLDLVVLPGSPRARLAAQLVAAYAGGAHRRDRTVRIRRVQQVSIRGPVGATVYADGDPLGTVPISMQVQADALALLAPPVGPSAPGGSGA